MKLVIRRSQIDAPSGFRFVLSYKLEVSPEEAELIKRFAPTYHFTKNVDVWTLADHWVTFEEQDARDLRDREDKVKKACQKLRERLEYAQQYTGQEDFEF
jgi:ABC-type Fe3+-hydroxamate transport system substrate-binding protein